jgi:hypothetical protein
MTVTEPMPTSCLDDATAILEAEAADANAPRIDLAAVLPPMGAEHNMSAEAELEQQLRHSSFFVQAVLEQQGKLTAKLDAYVTGLLDVLVERGVVEPEALLRAVEHNRSQQDADDAARADDGKLPGWPTVVVRDDGDVGADGSTITEVECAERLAICHAACCSLPFPLSAQEIEGGKVKWDLGHPYMIRHDVHGCCVHNDRASGACTIYADRPGVCRVYDCRRDERIWKDFEAKILNEDFLGNRPRHDFHFHAAPAVPVTFGQTRGRPSLAGSRATDAVATP